MPGDLHVHQQVGDALLLLRCRVGAHQQEAPVGVMRGRGPQLLAVDDVVVAIAHGRSCARPPGRSRRPARRSPGRTSSRCCAMRGRKWRFCSSVPKAIRVGPIMFMLNEIGSGAGAMCSSSLKMYCLTGSQPVPPHSGAHAGVAQPLSCRMRCPAQHLLASRCAGRARPCGGCRRAARRGRRRAPRRGTRVRRR